MNHTNTNARNIRWPGEPFWIIPAMWINFPIVFAFNVVLVVMILKNRLLREDRSNLYYVFMSLSQCGVALTMITLAVHVMVTGLNSIKDTIQDDFQFTCATVGNGFSSLTICSLGLITVDKVMKIYYPFLYTKNYLVVLKIVGCFLIGVIVGTLMFIDIIYSALAVNSTFMVVLFLIATSNYFLYRNVKKQISAIMKNVVGSTPHDTHIEKRKIYKRQLNSLRTCAGVVLLFVIISLPTLCKTIVVVVYQGQAFERIPIYLFQISFHWDSLDGLLTPVVYMATNKTLRKSMRKTFCISRK